MGTFGQLDVLVNNAGTAIPKPFVEATLEELDHVIDLNLRGGVYRNACGAEAHQGRRADHHDRLVRRRAHHDPWPDGHTRPQKGAVKNVSRRDSPARSGAGAITVNNVQPGPIDTDLNPASGDWATPQKAATALNRYGHVDEVAALVAFIASPEGVLHHRGKPDR